jgi:hypothetical protein
MEQQKEQKPVDVNKLTSILAASKAIMKKVDGGDYSTGNIDTSRLIQNDGSLIDEQQMVNNGFQPVRHNNTNKPSIISSETISNSRLPESIKKIMLETPIEQPTYGHTFSLDDVSDLIEKPIPNYQQPKKQVQHYPTEMLSNTEYQKNDRITVSEAVLRGIVKDVLIEYLTNDLTKKITETTVKSTIAVLLKEGKIKK